MMRRDWRLPALGGVAVLLTLIAGYQLLGDAGAPPAPTPTPVSLPSPALFSAQVPTPPPVPAASSDGLRLHGVTGAGAIISGGDGRQRLVAIGRDVLPGLTLAQVRIDHALLRSANGDIRLDFAGATASAAQSAPADSAGPDDALRYRLGLAPRRVDGRVVGHEVRAGAELPALTAAGIRPGDLILSVNGSRLDEERVAELAWTLTNSDRVEFEIERGGRPLQLSSSR